MITFSAPKPTNLKLVKTVRHWVEDALPPEKEDVTVMVNEMQCFEPGCAPVETVISLLDPMKPIMFKIFAPISDVVNGPTGQANVLAALQKALDGAEQPQHKTDSTG